MAEAGEVIVNPGTGERVEFLQTRAMTDGALLEFELTLAPLGRVGGVPHQHPATETVEVLDGVLSCRLRHERHELRAGDRFVLPAGKGHYLFNDTHEPVRARVQATPAWDFETFFETVFALAHERQYKAFRGLPPPLHGALLSRTYEVYAPGLPIGAQRAVLDRLVPLALKRGYPVQLPPIRADQAGSSSPRSSTSATSSVL
jgi:mannose-6-phosphate isomerase-like protein (cupin superfamily)